jgi:hypothetical protein
MKLLIGRTITNNISSISNFGKRWAPKYVVKRTHCFREQYYVMDLYGYKWTPKKEKATVFRSTQSLDTELKCTRMMYEAHFEVVRI